MSDEKPRPDRPEPEYGQYATPQEQAQAIAASLPPVDLGAGPTDSSADAGAGREPLAAPSLPGASVSAPQATGVHRSASPFTSKQAPVAGGSSNRIVTVGLLALGLVYLLGGLPTYRDLSAALDAAYSQWGIGDYTSDSLAAVLGPVAIAFQVAVWLAAALVSLRLLRAGKVAWWVPVVGAVVTLVGVMILMFVAVLSDPAFAEYITAG